MRKTFTGLLILLLMPLTLYGEQLKRSYRIIVIDSYHAEYDWSHRTNEGLLSALKDGALISKIEKEQMLKEDRVQGQHIEYLRIRMDTKRQKSKSYISGKVQEISGVIDNYKPDIIFLGDDNAVENIGYAFLDEIYPIVFWGVNGKPDRYDFFESLDIPGHNITGIYQSMYQDDSAKLLKKLLPNIETMAVIGDNSKTSRARVAQIRALEKADKWPVKIKEYVLNDNYEQWKRKVENLSEEVD
ncbi:MAG: hypothetical protein HON32_03770 [Francisellaceae bacterium]|nr:hypothetical protein [Francisellaceae bacterium]MBT6538149.1 hypothetical protein [Francisellaceae bacterium]